jgi:hypothetical protein
VIMPLQSPKYIFFKVKKRQNTCTTRERELS